MLTLTPWSNDTIKQIVYTSLTLTGATIDSSWKVRIDLRLAGSEDAVKSVSSPVVIAGSIAKATLQIPAGELTTEGDYDWRTLLVDSSGNLFELDSGKVKVKVF